MSPYFACSIVVSLGVAFHPNSSCNCFSEAAHFEYQLMLVLCFLCRGTQQNLGGDVQMAAPARQIPYEV